MYIILLIVLNRVVDVTDNVMRDREIFVVGEEGDRKVQTHTFVLEQITIF